MTTKDIKIIPDYFKTYTDQVPDDMDLIEALTAHGGPYLYAEKDHYEAVGDGVYAQGKWTIKQILLHVIDTERIFAYRALRFARGDTSLLAGFEQDDYAAQGQVAHRSFDDMLAEYTAVRQSSIFLYQSLDHDRLLRSGEASGNAVSVLALGFMTCGHIIHHQRIIRDLYYPLMK